MIEKVKAYAKINVGLHVIRKKKTGYHALDMIMSRIDLYDELEFYDCDVIDVISNKEICEKKDNLCYKVATYISKKYAKNKGIAIKINKRIPIGSGMGGGSSDAAEVIKFLNKHWCLGLSKRKMKSIGFRFGRDIPFFIDSQIARVRGEGEKIKPLKSVILNDEIAIIVPRVKIKTKDVFEKCRIVSHKKMKLLIMGLKNNKYSDYAFNDLESATNKLTNNLICKIQKKVLGLGVKAVMSGSGPVVVCYNEVGMSEFKNNIKSVIDELGGCEIVFTKFKSC